MFRRPLKIAVVTALSFAVLYGGLISLPFLVSLKVEHDQAQAFKKLNQEFPVTVDPQAKRIVENARVNEYLLSEYSPLQAAVGSVGSVLGDAFEWVATGLMATPLYQNLAATDGRFIVINPGMRKEQVAAAFGNVLHWSEAERKQFLISSAVSTLSNSLSEGTFSPGTYLVTTETSPVAARALITKRFAEEVLSRYGTKVAEAVPLADALTIASLIQREAAGAADMRLVSGIIWNRLFINMRLQIDASVQYASANQEAGGPWWPAARPADLRIKSPYNTYLHAGLPPGPISNPSVASIIAALNPVATDCLFYFHDRLGQFHCSPTYKGHVTLLKQYFGRGK